MYEKTAHQQNIDKKEFSLPLLLLAMNKYA